MSLSRLAAVELQLIMQCVDVRSLMKFARCSRRLLDAASSSFAFATQSIGWQMCGYGVELPIRNLVEGLSTGLMKFVRCDLVFFMPAHKEVKYCADLISTLPRLTTLLVKPSVDFYPEVQCSLSSALLQSPVPRTLTALHFVGHNALGAETVAQLLSACIRLHTFELNACAVLPKGLCAIVAAAINHPTLQALMLCDTELGAEGVTLLAKLLCSSFSLTLLRLRKCSLTSQMAQMLLEASLQSRSLTRLNLAANPSVRPEEHEWAIVALKSKLPPITVVMGSM
jgi:hypothetical protein